MSLRQLRRAESNDQPEPSAADRSLGARAVGLAIVGVGAVLAADAIARRLESSGPSAVADRVRHRRGRSTPRGESSSERADDEAEPVDEDRLNADVADERRPGEAIDKWATENVQEEPATPGEITVDEDVAEELREE
ncbi:hypothetical protein C491_18664 [Natronococcus amylolyticus DSM 10524]|uniref:Uncharacterized protein n=1 Tax=Natronococcus amylolyticus DSM 10524 TaxID=1227497 RepID=L9X241_9EURY|nr:hypothetical protein [Natronococcus amylolyticus]ELY54653.1 hypothetical protein C491_18664 [Natronococcus amylolyticus DSM 10524]